MGPIFDRRRRGFGSNPVQHEVGERIFLEATCLSLRFLLVLQMNAERNALVFAVVGSFLFGGGRSLKQAHPYYQSQLL